MAPAPFSYPMSVSLPMHVWRHAERLNGEPLFRMGNIFFELAVILRSEATKKPYQ